jgi:hypothetical protein
MQDGPSTKLRLERASVQLGPRALQLLADIAERLAKGAKQYGGDFDDKPRDWVQETLEETADGLVYASMTLLEVREAKAADEARNRAARRISDEPAKDPKKEGYKVSRVDYGQNREPLGPDFYKHYGPPTERDGVWAECSKPVPSKHPAVEAMYQKHGALVCECSVCMPPAREEWEKTRAGCG